MLWLGVSVSRSGRERWVKVGWGSTGRPCAAAGFWPVELVLRMVLVAERMQRGEDAVGGDQEFVIGDHHCKGLSDHLLHLSSLGCVFKIAGDKVVFQVAL